MFVEQHLAQRASKPTGFDIGQPGETPAGQLDLDDLVRSPPQMQRGPPPVTITTGNRAVVPSQPT